MSKRLAFLAAASPLALFVVPLQAQAQVDSRYAQVDQVIETYSEPVVQDTSGWEAETGASYAHGDYGSDDAVVEDSRPDWNERPMRGPQRDPMHGRPHRGDHDGMMQRPATLAPGQPRALAYSPADRAEWLSQCRALHANDYETAYAEPERDRNGGIIGGVLGAVAGGVVGNQVTNRHRLAGTLIGAGVGGIAGAIIGSVIDRASDRTGRHHRDDDDRHAEAQEPGFDYCAAYLLNYERGYGVPQQLAYAQVMMVPVATQGMAMEAHGARRVIEEEIEVEVDRPASHRPGRRPHRQPDGDKRIPIR